MAKKKVKAQNKYGKNDIIKSNKFAEYVDVLHVILEDDKLYSVDEVKSLIEKFLKGKVK